MENWIWVAAVLVALGAGCTGDAGIPYESRMGGAGTSPTASAVADLGEHVLYLEFANGEVNEFLDEVDWNELFAVVRVQGEAHVVLVDRGVVELDAYLTAEQLESTVAPVLRVEAAPFD
ncbi:MAG: hypothetical protein H6700_13055, partial [Myxococcales bacterium]|nr:hypothetical protein [Myxococcales bacterium]